MPKRPEVSTTLKELQPWVGIGIVLRDGFQKRWICDVILVRVFEIFKQWGFSVSFLTFFNVFFLFVNFLG